MSGKQSISYMDADGEQSLRVVNGKDDNFTNHSMINKNQGSQNVLMMDENDKILE